MTSDANQFLMGNGGKSASFLRIKDAVDGTVLKSEVRQQTDFKTKKPLFWDDGSPRQQLVITLLTEEHDDEEDDGIRVVFAKNRMLSAIRQAVVQAKARGLEDGGRLWVQFTGEEENGTANPTKLYRAKYQAPTHSTPIPDEPLFDASDEPF